MKKKFSKSWKGSKQPRKQRKYLANLPLHLKKKLLSATLSKELRKKYSRRNVPLKKGDKVKVMRGNHRKKEGEILKVDKINTKVNIAGIEIVKKDGSKVPYPISPSNLMITELKLDDKKRIQALERNMEKQNVKSTH
jgi:large subunit ribosomal protein L24